MFHPHSRLDGRLWIFYAKNFSSIFSRLRLSSLPFHIAGNELRRRGGFPAVCSSFLF